MVTLTKAKFHSQPMLPYASSVVHLVSSYIQMDLFDSRVFCFKSIYSMKLSSAQYQNLLVMKNVWANYLCSFIPTNASFHKYPRKRHSSACSCKCLYHYTIFRFNMILSSLFFFIRKIHRNRLIQCNVRVFKFSHSLSLFCTTQHAHSYMQA